MIKAFVLVCIAGTAPQDCQRNTPAVVNQVEVPGEFNSVQTCMMHGQAYVAEVGLALAGDVVKVYCGRPNPTPADKENLG